MDAGLCVLDSEPLHDVGRDAGVVLGRAFIVLEDVDESLGHNTDRAAVVPAKNQTKDAFILALDGVIPNSRSNATLQKLRHDRAMLLV